MCFPSQGAITAASITMFSQCLVDMVSIFATVSIARAMLKNAPILLCDEPTSSLDTSTEHDVMQQLSAMGQDRTTVIVAHRLSTVKDADIIIVLDQGKLVQQGSHEELVRSGGKYAELLRQLPR